MARRQKESDALTREELADLRQSMAELSIYDAERFYRTVCVALPSSAVSVADAAAGDGLEATQEVKWYGLAKR